MPNNDSTQNAGDNAALERSTSQPSETTANLHHDTNMGQVGDTSSNQAWSQMTGGSVGGGGADRGSGGSGGDSNSSGRMDFSGDIYKGGSNGGGAGSDQSNGPSNMEQGSHGAEHGSHGAEQNPQSRGISESSQGADNTSIGADNSSNAAEVLHFAPSSGGSDMPPPNSNGQNEGQDGKGGSPENVGSGGPGGGSDLPSSSSGQSDGLGSSGGNSNGRLEGAGDGAPQVSSDGRSLTDSNGRRPEASSNNGGGNGSMEGGGGQADLDRGLDSASINNLYGENASFSNTQSHEGMYKTYELRNPSPPHDAGEPPPDNGPSSGNDGYQNYGQTDAGPSGKGDKGADAGDQSAKSTDGRSGDAPPELSLPSPHDMANAPVDQLQQASREQRQALANYIDGQGENFPHVALHGTNAQSGKNLENLPNRGGEIFAAGQAPERRDMGADQMVGDIGKSAETAFGYAENRQNSTGANQPGPVMVYDAKNQPEAFQKNNYGNGSESGDHSSFAQLDLGKANLVGSVPREQIDGMKQNFAPIEGALRGVSDNIASDPKGINQDRVNDLSARVKVMDEMKGHHQTKLVLDAVHRGRGPRW